MPSARPPLPTPTLPCGQGSLVLDATGHARKLVNYDQKFDPGYQGAYGITAGAWLREARAKVEGERLAARLT